MTTLAGVKAQKKSLRLNIFYNGLNLLKTWPFSSHGLYTQWCKQITSQLWQC